MAYHKIEPERATLHGHFSRDLAPILTIDSGDTVQYRLLDAGWGLEAPKPDTPERRHFEPRTELDRGHALCGPLAIRDAVPGMMLGITFKTIIPGAWGGTYAGGSIGGGEFNRRLGVAKDRERGMIWTLDAEKMIGTNQQGQRVALKPFLGVVGMPPDEAGTHSTAPPRFCGGNIDCKELVVGSTLYLPISVAGGLISVGDGHGTQGDGEVCGTAIECPMEHVEIVYTLHEDTLIKRAHANTPAGWITFGFDENLEEAMYAALNAMLDLMMAQTGMSRPDALALASLIVDLRITQIVNGVRGVHAVLPHGALL